MPRRKKIESEQVQPEVKPAGETRQVKQVKFEGARVTSILKHGHTKTHLHCALSDGTTKHVPRELFDK